MRQKSVAFQYFIARNTPDSKKSVCRIQRFECKFCKKSYALHATRMLEHLVKCSNCPENIRNDLAKQAKLPAKSPKREFIQLPILPASPFPDLPTRSNSSTISPETKNLQKLLARAIYASGTPLNVVTNTYWIEFFKNLNPAFELPSNVQLSTSLLRDIYNETQLNNKEKILTAKNVGIQCELWTNNKNENVVNLIVTRPEPLCCQTFSHFDSDSEEYLTEKIDAAFYEIDVNKIIGLCFNNYKYFYKPCQVLSKRYSEKPISFYQCCIVTLNLLIADIMRIKVTQNFLKAVKIIIQTIIGNTVLLRHFQRIQKQNLSKNECVLLEPPDTGWESVISCLERLEKNKTVLRDLALVEGCEELLGENNTENILDKNLFWETINNLLLLLNLFKKWIQIFEADNYRISDVPCAFFEIDQLLNSGVMRSTLVKNDFITSFLSEKRKMCVKQVHLAANILNPGYKGKHLKAEEIIDGLEYIHKLARHFANIDENMILENIADYRSGSGFWNMDFVKISAENSNISPITFWKGICTDLPLRFIAEMILCQPAACGSTQKVLSANQTVLSKENNEMLFYIQHNLSSACNQSISSNDTSKNEADKTVLKNEELSDEDDEEITSPQISSVLLQINNEPYYDSDMSEEDTDTCNYNDKFLKSEDSLSNL